MQYLIVYFHMFPISPQYKLSMIVDYLYYNCLYIKNP